MYNRQQEPEQECTGDHGGRVLLVVGGDSLVGRALIAHWIREKGGEVIATTRRAILAADEPKMCRFVHLDLLDVTKEADASAWAATALQANQYDQIAGVALCAAVARIGDCERDPEGTRRVNVDSMVALARHFARSHVPVLFCSSDKVYDGTQPMRKRTEPTCPVTQYGRQKADVERAILSLHDEDPGAPMAILRLSKIVAPHLALFHGWAASLVRGQPITPFFDMHLAPVPVELVAQTIARIVRERRSGIFQLSGDADATYADAATHICQALGGDPSALIHPQPSLSTPAAAAHTTLDMSIELSLWGLQAPSMAATLGQYLACSIARALSPSDALRPRYCA